MTRFCIISLLFFRISFGFNEVSDFKNSEVGSIRLKNATEAFDFSGKATLEKGEVIRVAREFRLNSQDVLLVFRERDMRTFFITKSDLNSFSAAKSTIFMRREPIKSLHTFGEIRPSFALTIDLCAKPANPERKFERGLFEALKRESLRENRALPVAIAVTGRWLLKSKREFEYLKGLNDAGFLAITWVNHSTHHEINNGKFLTARGTNFREEVLGVERALLERGVMPGAFFRFPGLIFNEELLDELASFSLIPLGADAWLAKDEKLHDGAIILIHGNGNEPHGIRLFLEEKRFFGGMVDVRNSL